MIKRSENCVEKKPFHVIHRLNGGLVIKVKLFEPLEPLKPLKPFPKQT